MKKLNHLAVLGAFAVISNQAFANTVTQVPEPSTLSLLFIGLFGLGLARRRMKSADKN